MFFKNSLFFAIHYYFKQENFFAAALISNERLLLPYSNRSVKGKIAWDEEKYSNLHNFL